MQIGCACKPEEYAGVSLAGFDYAELPCRTVCEMNERDFDELCHLVGKTDFPVRAMNIYCPPKIVIAGPGYSATAAGTYAHAAALRGKALGVESVGIGSPFSRNLPEGFDKALADRQLAEFLTITAEAFGEVGINVNLEALGPCYCNFINTLKEACEAVSAADVENLGIVLDFYNMEHSGEADIDLREYMSLIRHAHISDDDGAPSLRSYLRSDKHLIHKHRIQGLLDSGYDGGITIEVDVAFDARRAKESLAAIRNTINP
jgi:sugar phosphate isomerase/epimerase